MVSIERLSTAHTVLNRPKLGAPNWDRVDFVAKTHRQVISREKIRDR